jgi:hypothetical protein
MMTCGLCLSFCVQEFDWLENIYVDVHFGYDSWCIGDDHNYAVNCTGEIRSKGDTVRHKREKVVPNGSACRQESNLLHGTKWCEEKVHEVKRRRIFCLVGLPPLFLTFPFLWWNDVELTAECYERITRSTISIVTHTHTHSRRFTTLSSWRTFHETNRETREELAWATVLEELVWSLFDCIFTQLLTRRRV